VCNALDGTWRRAELRAQAIRDVLSAPPPGESTEVPAPGSGISRKIRAEPAAG
jgi:hypothetical protein